MCKLKPTYGLQVEGREGKSDKESMKLSPCVSRRCDVEGVNLEQVTSHIVLFVSNLNENSVIFFLVCFGFFTN